MYRLSEHSLAIEKGWRRQTWLSRETQDTCTLPTKWVGNWAVLPNLLPNVWPYQRHISLRLYRSTKNLKTNPILINSNIYWVKYHSVTSQQQDVWPDATRKGQPVKNKHHCKYNPYLCLFIFPFVQATGVYCNGSHEAGRRSYTGNSTGREKASNVVWKTRQ
jgi:hypothetical protein